MHLKIKNKTAWWKFCGPLAGASAARILAAGQGAETFIKHADNLAYVIDPIFDSAPRVPFSTHQICYFENVDGSIRYSLEERRWVQTGVPEVEVSITYAESSQEANDVLRSVLLSTHAHPLDEDEELEEVVVAQFAIPQEQEERARMYTCLMERINSMYQRRICNCKLGFTAEGEDVCKKCILTCDEPYRSMSTEFCTVCLGSSKTLAMVKLDCGHYFHPACLNVEKLKGKCPCCRRPINGGGSSGGE